jgi:hypothetical protein
MPCATPALLRQTSIAVRKRAASSFSGASSAATAASSRAAAMRAGAQRLGCRDIGRARLRRGAFERVQLPSPPSIASRRAREFRPHQFGRSSGWTAMLARRRAVRTAASRRLQRVRDHAPAPRPARSDCSSASSPRSPRGRARRALQPAGRMIGNPVEPPRRDPQDASGRIRSVDRLPQIAFRRSPASFSPFCISARVRRAALPRRVGGQRVQVRPDVRAIRGRARPVRPHGVRSASCLRRAPTHRIGALHRAGVGAAKRRAAARCPRGFSRPRSSCWPWIRPAQAPNSRSSATLAG